MAKKKLNPIGTLATETRLILRMNAAQFFAMVESMSEVNLPDNFVVSVSSSCGKEICFSRKTEGIEIYGEGEV